MINKTAMKKISLLLTALSFSVIICAQNINYAEYFIDTDPGYGMAIPITVPEAGTDVSLGFTADIALISPGLHFLTIRTRDDLGRWSHGTNSIFYHVKTVAVIDREIHQAEYFIDTDPGYGNGTQVTLPSVGSDLNIDFNVSINGLDTGNHVLYVRAKNEQNKWGQVFAEVFALNPTGVDQEEIITLFKIYPNPGMGNFRFELSDNIQPPLTIQIMDLVLAQN